MDKLVNQKKVRNIGVSNFSLDQTIEAQKYSKHKFAAVQVEYNLVERDDGKNSKKVESEVIPYCQKNGIFVMAYNPLSKGDLTKLRVHPSLDRLVVKYKKTPAQLLLNWLLSKKNIVTIFRTTNLEHMVENLGALGWTMDEEDIQLLNNSHK